MAKCVIESHLLNKFLYHWGEVATIGNYLHFDNIFTFLVRRCFPIVTIVFVTRVACFLVGFIITVSKNCATDRKNL